MNDPLTRRTFIRNTSLAVAAATLSPIMSQAQAPSADQERFDALIIGGSFAGLSAAMSLGRARRKVLVLDAGRPCNHMVKAAHNLIMHDGAPPQQMLAAAREQLAAYPTVTLLNATAARIEGEDGSFSVQSNLGVHAASKVLLATGVRDRPLPIAGFAECWGISVLHCPFCHGYEVVDLPLAVLGDGAMGLEFVRMIRNWSRDLTLLTNGPSTLEPEQQRELSERGIRIEQRAIAQLDHQGGQVTSAVFQDGERLALSTLFARPPFALPEELLSNLACARTESGHIQVDPMQRTTVAGVFAAGDVASPMRSLAFAMSAGNMAGGAITHALVSQWQ
jgi:thioredoxin reductase